MPEEQPIYPQDVYGAVGGQNRNPIESGLNEPNVRFADFLFTDKSIPKDMRKTDFWAFSDKEMALSNLQEKDISRVMNSADVTHLFELMSRPDYETDWQSEVNYRQFRAKLFVKLSRSKDGFAAKLLSTQIRQSIIQEGPAPASGGIGGGIRGMLGKFFGGGK